MTLNQIAAEIDSLLSRLCRARDILATLAPTPVAVSAAVPLPPLPIPEPPAAAAPPVPRPTRKVAPRQSRPRAPRHTPRPATALQSTIPQGPVAVSAADAVRSRSLPETPAPTAPNPTAGHSLDDLVRELTRRNGALTLAAPRL